VFPKTPTFAEAEQAIVESNLQINPKQIVDQDMKMRTSHPGEVLALILASALCVSTPCLAAQTSYSPQQPGQPPQTQRPGQMPQTQQPTPQPGQQAQPGQQPQGPQASQTFTGKIVKLTNGQFALLTGQSAEGKATGHFLDDQASAQKFEGKQVTVTGTFDEANNMIHVTNIQAA